MMTCVILGQERHPGAGRDPVKNKNAWIPAFAGTSIDCAAHNTWIPAFAGMTMVQDPGPGLRRGDVPTPG